MASSQFYLPAGRMATSYSDTTDVYSIGISTCPEKTISLLDRRVKLQNQSVDFSKGLSDVQPTGMSDKLSAITKRTRRLKIPAKLYLVIEMNVQNV
jgi:hypothetical protein